MKKTFAELVYAATCQIPRGEVRTYTDIAKAIGKPKAARAVGNALHHNPTLLTVPCHRVVRGNGSLGGYAGGIKKKKQLLQSEGVVVAGNRVTRFFSIK